MAAVALVTLHVAIQLVHHRVAPIAWWLRDLFDLDVEQALGTWLAATLLLAAAAAALRCGFAEARDVLVARSWTALATLLLCLSVDEVAGFHETLNTVTRTSWAIPGGVAAVLVGLAFFPFLGRLPLRTRTLLLYAGIVYVTGAVGVELCTEHLVSATDTLAYGLATALEEGLEMAGVLLCIRAGTVHHAATTAG